jgi:hypothetical protein
VATFHTLITSGCPRVTGNTQRDELVHRALAATLDPATLLELPQTELILPTSTPGAEAYARTVSPTVLGSYHARLIRVMAVHGIVDPADALGAALYTDVESAVICTSLDMESYGGRNQFGGDPGGSALPTEWFESPVTYPKWEVYWANVHRGLWVNGVGSMQLTDESLQELANKLGGCWLQLPNRKVGAIFMRQLIAECHGDVQAAYTHYNGSGPDAILYGQHAYALYSVWKRELEAAR